MNLLVQQQFGTLLKKFRKQKGKYPILGQKELARALHMSADAISKWERNLALPASRKKVLQLANVLHIIDTEVDQLLLAANFPLLFEHEKRDSKQTKWSTGQQKRAIDVPSVPTPLWNVPHQHNPYFIGREKLLEYVHETLSHKQTAAITHRQAISGLGGIGKTQVALEYAYQYHDDYKAVLWVRADSYDTLLSDFVSIANVVDLPEKRDQDQNRIVNAVKRWFHEHTTWLLILDNADDLVTIQEFMPTLGKGHILLTTRAHSVGQLTPHPIELDVLEQEEGILLLLRRAGILSISGSLDTVSEKDLIAASQLVQEVQGLPLALEQAGAYIEEIGCSLSQYLKLYQTHHTDLLKRRSQFSDYHYTVATTWSMSFQQIEVSNPFAAEILRFCAFLQPDAIPEDIFIDGGESLGPLLSQDSNTPLLRDTAIEALLRYSLVKRNAEMNILTIHRLVQTVLKDAMVLEQQNLWAERTIRVINNLFPEVNPETWIRCQRYLSHAQVCAMLIDQYNFVFPEARQLLTKAGNYLAARAQSAQAEALLQRALEINEQILGPSHPDTASSLDHLGCVYWRQNKFTEAEALYKRALKIREQVLGSLHPDTAQSYENLGTIYREQQGKDAETEKFQLRALEVYEQTLGPDHPKTAVALHYLGWFYTIHGKYKEAEPLFQRSLEINERTQEPGHLNTASNLFALGWLYNILNRYKEAEPLYLQALKIREDVLGPDHPDTAECIMALGWLYRQQGKYKEAEDFSKRALEIREKVLGPSHWHTAQSTLRLGMVYHDQKNYVEAEPLYIRARTICEQALGLNNSNTANCINFLAHLYRDQGKYELAEPLYQQALKIYEQTLSVDHPNVAHSLYGLAILCRNQGKYIEAEAFYQRALAIREKVLGAEHPDTIATKEQYVTLLQQIHQDKTSSKEA